MEGNHEYFMRRAMALAEKGMNANEGGPFGVVIVKNGIIISEGNNQVILTNDPTAHAEIVAIREACSKLESFQLDDCIIYTSCEPCPMCMGAIYWSRPEKVFFSCTKHDAKEIGFDDEYIYREIQKEVGGRDIPFYPLLREQGLEVFKKWMENPNKVLY